MITKYTIKAGKHYCRKSIKDLLRTLIPSRNRIKTISLTVKFTKSCLIDTGLQLNKLGGISQFGSRHKNSVRVAWRAEQGKIRLALYWYKDGVHGEHLSPTLIDIDKEYQIIIFTSQNSNRTYLIYGIDGKSGALISATDCTNIETIKNYTYSFPYIGGKITADKDVDIELSLKLWRA